MRHLLDYIILILLIVFWACMFGILCSFVGVMLHFQVPDAMLAAFAYPALASCVGITVLFPIWEYINSLDSDDPDFPNQTKVFRKRP